MKAEMDAAVSLWFAHHHAAENIRLSAPTEPRQLRLDALPGSVRASTGLFVYAGKLAARYVDGARSVNRRRFGINSTTRFDASYFRLPYQVYHASSAYNLPFRKIMKTGVAA